jgi:hypothetical protein
MAAPDPPPPPDATEAAFDNARSRSPLQDWMRKHHTMLARRLKERRLLWSEIARVLAEQGVRDAKGNPPTADAARRAWTRVTEGRASRSQQPSQKQAVEAPSTTAKPGEASEAPSAPLPAPPAQPAPPGLPSVSRPPVDLTEGVNPPPKPKFGFARPR